MRPPYGTLLTVLIAILCTGPSAAAPAQPVPEPPAPSDNAAVWYLTAQYLLGRSDEQPIGTLTGNDAFASDDASKRQALEALEGTLAYIRRAGSLEDCDWAVDLKRDGPNAILPHLQIVREQADLLIKIAWFLAEEQGGLDQAIADTVTTMRMSRHAANDGTLVGCLVQYRIDDAALGMLSNHLHLLDRNQLSQLRGQLGALPPRRTVRGAIASERLIAGWLRRTSAEMGPTQLAGLLEQSGDSSELLPEAFEKSDRQTRMKMIAEWLDELDKFYDELAEIAGMALQDSKRAGQALNKNIQAGDNPIAKLLLPAIHSARERELEYQARRAILDAMIAYRLGGEQAFVQVVDPIDGKPFDFEKAEHHLFVQSRKLNAHGVHVRLMFSHEAGTPLE